MGTTILLMSLSRWSVIIYTTVTMRTLVFLHYIISPWIDERCAQSGTFLNSPLTFGPNLLGCIFISNHHGSYYEHII